MLYYNVCHRDGTQNMFIVQMKTPPAPEKANIHKLNTWQKVNTHSYFNRSKCNNRMGGCSVCFIWYTHEVHITVRRDNLRNTLFWNKIQIYKVKSSTFFPFLNRMSQQDVKLGIMADTGKDLAHQWQKDIKDEWHSKDVTLTVHFKVPQAPFCYKPSGVQHHTSFLPHNSHSRSTMSLM